MGDSEHYSVKRHGAGPQSSKFDNRRNAMSDTCFVVACLRASTTAALRQPPLPLHSTRLIASRFPSSTALRRQGMDALRLRPSLLSARPGAARPRGE
jgi:hypothetical protein